MLSMSMSFRMGHGSIEHNLRITKGRGIRQNGVIERRYINEYPVYDTDVEGNDYGRALLLKAVKAEMGDKLDRLNEHHIRGGHTECVKTIEQWLQAQEYTRQGKPKPVTCEYIVQLGDKYTACPYLIQHDKDGNMIDVDGRRIPIWDTRSIPAYRDGKIQESAISRRLKDVYKEFLDEFIKRNPRARVLSAAIHCDERSCHMHITVLWVSRTRNGVGFGLGHTLAMRQQYEDAGIKVKTGRKNNAQNQWRVDMRKLLEQVAKWYGIERKDMHNHNKYQHIGQYKRTQDEYCEELEQRTDELDVREEMLNLKERALSEKEHALNEKESALSENIAKQEWYILKKNHPDIYKMIHSEYLKNNKKVLDRETDIVYNR